MNSQGRLDRVSRLLTGAVMLQALLWAAAIGGLLLVVAGGLALVLNLPAQAQPIITLGSLVASMIVAARLLWINRRVRSRVETALWLENRIPVIGYSLVTLAEGRFVDRTPALDAMASSVKWTGPVRSALVRRLVPPAVLLLGVFVLLALMPATPLDRIWISGETAQPGSHSTSARADPFRSFVVRVVPPPYTGLAETRLEDPEAVTSLVGSRIEVLGNGWNQRTIMPDTATPFWLEQQGRRQLLLLLPIPDSVPAVELVVPQRDSVLREMGGTLQLSGSMRDDFGLGRVWFEYIVSSGEGENYTFRSGVIGAATVTGRKNFDLLSGLHLDSLKLAPGNIIHLRAVARDRNTMTGPGEGYSETRTLRVPRPGEGDSVAVGQVAPAQGDSSMLSQRMLLLRAQALHRRRSQLNRDTLVGESRKIAGDQATLRRRVADIIFLRLGSEGSMEESQDSTAEPLTPEALLEAAEQATVASGGEMLDFAEDETPVVALNRPLLEAYNAMWAAGRELEVGEPGRALPHMREALEAIQRARQAERIYLRGRPVAPVIDVAKVRLAGRLADAQPSQRNQSSPDGRLREALIARYSRLLDRLDQSDIVDSLQILRLEAVGTEPRFAASLGDAVTALRNGTNATDALIRARRLLVGDLVARPGLPPWDMAP